MQHFSECSDDAVNALASFLGDDGNTLVLTGAGCSTESGIPDYRSPGGAWARHKPITIAEFRGDELRRRNYWARSFLGWPRFANAQPNAAHRALAGMHRGRRITSVVTQNVDRLHQAAGCDDVVELHGRLHEVSCLQCAASVERAQFQTRLAELNPTWRVDPARHAPDGDAEIDRELTKDFVVPACECGGMLKPAVVFFGENVARPIVDDVMQRVERAARLFVVGSSLMVWSGFRFARRAHELGKPIALLNIGPTRADELASVKIEARCGEFLERVAVRIT